MDQVYFQMLQHDLKRYGQGVPWLVVDKLNFFHNLKHVKALFKAQIHPRVVVKSLANLALLQEVSDYLNTDRFMVFHIPQLQELLAVFPQADVLLGKPMPLQALSYFYQQSPQYKTADIQWLIDSPQRLQQYLKLAQQQNLKLKINIEIDVGLHRGGVQSEVEFLQILKLLLQYPEHLKFSGLMGYDAHVAKLPTWLKKVEVAYCESQTIYQNYQALILKHYPELWHDQLCFNGGGSPTLMLHTQKSVCNDVAFGSIVLKPSSFDLELLHTFKPAVWLVTPVLKVLPKVEIPALEILQKFPIKQQAVFIYGGYWLADYVYPKGLKVNLLYGRSSNQELLTAPLRTAIAVDDYVIARPQQTEAILPQFNQVYWYDQHQFKALLNMRE